MARRKKAMGRRIAPSGYVHVWCPGHPMARQDGYALEHRKILWDSGVALKSTDDVHHVNGDRADNRIENLEVLDHGEHKRRHFREEGVRNGEGVFPLRTTPEERLERQIRRHGHGHEQVYGAGCRCEPCRASRRARSIREYWAKKRVAS